MIVYNVDGSDQVVGIITTIIVNKSRSRGFYYLNGINYVLGSMIMVGRNGKERRVG